MVPFHAVTTWQLNRTDTLEEGIRCRKDAAGMMPFQVILTDQALSIDEKQAVDMLASVHR